MRLLVGGQSCAKNFDLTAKLYSCILEASTGVIVSPLATLAFELCAVGDTGLKTGWVRCRHEAGGAGRGGAGRCGVGWGGTVV